MVDERLQLSFASTALRHQWCWMVLIIFHTVPAVIAPPSTAAAHLDLFERRVVFVMRCVSMCLEVGHMMWGKRPQITGNRAFDHVASPVMSRLIQSETAVLSMVQACIHPRAISGSGRTTWMRSTTGSPSAGTGQTRGLLLDEGDHPSGELLAQVAQMPPLDQDDAVRQEQLQLLFADIADLHQEPAWNSIPSATSVPSIQRWTSQPSPIPVGR
ncbi:MAG: hypothetical protein HZY74_08280 [Brevundimonas sp.]|nr:MAG: hypothetical protein HZY74_08280 [Brevundimonas sp.]